MNDWTEILSILTKCKWGGGSRRRRLTEGQAMPRKKLGRKVTRARELRKRPSLPEALLWRLLRRSPGGIDFRRQHPIGPYVLDFYCTSKKLAIEVDGVAHDMGDRPRRDDVRTEWLKRQGVEILRIPAKEVLADPESVAESLIRLCTEPLHPSAAPSGPPPQPSAREERGADTDPPYRAAVGRRTAAEGGGGGVP